MKILLKNWPSIRRVIEPSELGIDASFRNIMYYLITFFIIDSNFYAAMIPIKC